MCRKLICLISLIGLLTSASQADLVGLWRFDEGSGSTASDSSGNGHHGTLVGDPKWAGGKNGGALDFDGQDDLVELGKFDVVGPGITLAGWIRPDTFAINDGRIITKAVEWGENDHWWMLSTIASGGESRLRFRLKTEGQSTTTLIASSGALVVEEWQHAAATWDGTTMRLHLNGEEVGSAAKDGAAVATNPDASASIGSQPSDAFAPATPDHVNKFFDGLIDEVRLYNNALTAEQLEGIMQGEGYPYASSPDPANGNSRCPLPEFQALFLFVLVVIFVVLVLVVVLFLISLVLLALFLLLDAFLLDREDFAGLGVHFNARDVLAALLGDVEGPD